MEEGRVAFSWPSAISCGNVGTSIYKDRWTSNSEWPPLGAEPDSEANHNAEREQGGVLLAQCHLLQQEQEQVHIVRRKVHGDDVR